MNNFKLAREFIKEHRLKKDYTYSDLKHIAKKYGYDVYEWQKNFQHDILLFENLDCVDLSRHSETFTCESESKKIIFVNKTLTLDEKKITLLHELIHIKLGHLDINKKIKIIEEKKTTDIHFIIDFVLKYEKMLRALTLIEFTLITTMIILAVNIKTAVSSPQQQQLSDYVYITPTGYHYHTENCTYGVEYDNSFKISRSDADLYYLPCSNCNADKY